MFGERLKELREDKSMTQEMLAQHLNTSRQTISGYETGLSEPSLDSLVKLSDFFNVSLDYLCGRTKEKINLNLFDNAHKEIILDLIGSLGKYNITKK